MEHVLGTRRRRGRFEVHSAAKRDANLGDADCPHSKFGHPEDVVQSKAVELGVVRQRQVQLAVDLLHAPDAPLRGLANGGDSVM
jgi:hypothetical protein